MSLFRVTSAMPSKPLRLRRLGWLLLLVPLLAGARDAAPMSRDDIAWLQRMGFGIDSAQVARYRELGRARYLDEQLAPGNGDTLPPSIQAQIDSYEAISTPMPQLVAELYTEPRRIQSMTDPVAKAAATKALNKRKNYQIPQQAQQAELLRFIYGSDQLREQMVWFWLNHFSVFAPKAIGRWVVADYAEHTIRPRALGKFRDLVMATLESPSMQYYLDNIHNVKGKTNENYARELLELHTLGVGSGYTQQDVQQLALILTGVGVAPLDGKEPRIAPRWQPQVVRHGLFLFNPALHDFSDKVFLGHTIKGSGFAEVEQAVDLIVRQPACAKFVSRQLAEYFVSDNPPPALVAAMAATFQRSDGDIAAVMRTLLTSPELTASYGKKFKDPTQFVVSAIRLAYDGRPISNPAAPAYWLTLMGEPLFGHIAPNGYPLDSASWTSSGQMAKRFEIANMIGTGANDLFKSASGVRDGPAHPQIDGSLYRSAIEPALSQATREALAKAKSPTEWNAFLLSSPDFNYR